MNDGAMSSIRPNENAGVHDNIARIVPDPAEAGIIVYHPTLTADRPSHTVLNGHDPEPILRASRLTAHGAVKVHRRTIGLHTTAGEVRGLNVTECVVHELHDAPLRERVASAIISIGEIHLWGDWRANGTELVLFSRAVPPAAALHNKGVTVPRRLRMSDN
jgi:hypothetical protein